MQIQHYIRNNKPVWSELEQLLIRFERNKRTLTAADIDRLASLYRSVSAHLAYTRTYYPRDELSSFLNQLVSRAHHALHAEQWKGSERLGDFFKRRFIGYLLARRAPVLIAFLLFLLGGIGGFLAVWQDPLAMYTLLPDGMAERINPAALGQQDGQWLAASSSATIMTNNIRVAILAFAGGITFGLLTVYAMVYNGILVGTLAAVYWQAGKTYAFWAYILPHGIIELTAIFIAGGAGLYMGYRMISPGLYGRKYMLLRSIKESALLLVGTIPLFIIAGLIEGYITPSTLPLFAKYLAAGATLVALILYGLYGRLNERRYQRKLRASGQGPLGMAADGDAYGEGRALTKLVRARPAP